MTDAQKPNADAVALTDGLGLVPERHKHTSTKCPESGLRCGYWIGHYRAEAARWRKEAETLQQTVHNQRNELARLYGERTTK